MGNLGTATSFFNEKNRNIVTDLVELLVETNQEVPSFLQEMIASERYTTTRRNNNNRSMGGNRYGGSGFTSRDFRQNNSGNSNRNSSNRGNSGNSGGSRGGNSGYGNKSQIFYDLRNFYIFSF
jgi:ATP-dependent RNA helicase DDX3X